MSLVEEQTQSWGGINTDEITVEEVRTSDEYNQRSVPGMKDTPFELYMNRYPTGGMIVINADTDEIVLTGSKNTDRVRGFIVGYLYEQE